MGLKLCVEVEDSRTSEEEVWTHYVDSKTPWTDVITAVSTLYPDAKSVKMYAIEEPS